MPRTRDLPLGLIAALVVYTAISAIAAVETQSAPETSDICRTDVDIPIEYTESIEQTALGFVRSILEADIVAAYAEFSPQRQAQFTSDEFQHSIIDHVRNFGPFMDLRVAHRYFLDMSNRASSSETGMVQCSYASKGAIDANDQVFVRAKPNHRQAHVVVEGDAGNNTFGFVLWLILNQSKWQIEFLEFVPTATVGRSARDLWVAASQQRERGHDLIAYLLYEAARDLAFRGPAFELGMRREILRELSMLSKPRELRGTAPAFWDFGNAKFQVLFVTVAGIEGKLCLIIRHEIDPWRDEKNAEAENLSFIREFTRTHPEYVEGFDVLLVQAAEHGGSAIFGTVHRTSEGP